MRNNQRIILLIIIILGILLCAAAILVLYSEINQHYPQASSVNNYALCDTTETNFIPSPTQLSFLIYFKTNQCYVSTDNISQVEYWYKKMGWRENLEGGGLVKDSRTNLMLVNIINIHRVFLSANNQTTEINAEIMISVDVFQK